MAVKKATKAELSRRGRSNRNRGKCFERDVANALKEVYPLARRLYGQSRKGADAPDVGGTPFWVECGTGGTVAIREKLAQALRDSAASEDPRWTNKPAAVFTRSRDGERIVSMRQDQFINLLKQIESAWKILEEGDHEPKKQTRGRA
jgi:hypothetical protein